MNVFDAMRKYRGEDDEESKLLPDVTQPMQPKKTGAMSVFDAVQISSTTRAVNEQLESEDRQFVSEFMKRTEGKPWMKPFKAAFFGLEQMARPSAAIFGGMGGDYIKSWVGEMVKAAPRKPLENEIWLLDDEDFSTGKITWRVKNTDTGDITYESGVMPEEFRRSIPKWTKEGFKKGWKLEDYFTFAGVLKEYEDFFKPGQKKAWKIGKQVMAFGLDMAADPMNLPFDEAARLARIGRKAAGQSLRAGKHTANLMASIDNLPVVKGARRLFDLWSGKAKKAHIKSLQARAQEPQRILRLKGEFDKIGNLYKYTDDMIKRRGLKGRAAKDFKKEVSRRLLETSGLTRTGPNQKAMKLEPALRKSFADLHLTKLEFAHLRQFMNDTKHYYDKVVRPIKLKAGLPEYSYAGKPYYLPTRRPGRGYARAPFEAVSPSKAKSAFKRKIDDIDDYIGYIRDYADDIDLDLPQAIAKDTAEHIHVAVYRDYYDDITRGLRQLSPDMSDEVGRLFVRAKKGDFGFINRLKDWKAAGKHDDLIKALEGAGLRFDDTGKMKAWFKNHDLLETFKHLDLADEAIDAVEQLQMSSKSFIADAQVVDYLRSTEKVLFNNDAIKGWRKLFNAANLPFKYMATALNPAFHAKYYLTNLFQNWKGGVSAAKMPYGLSRATRLKLLGELGQEGMVRVGKQKYKADELWQLMADLGVTRRAKYLLTDTEARWLTREIKSLTDTNFIRRAKKANQYINPSHVIGHIDDVFRINLFLDYLDKAKKLPASLDDLLKASWEAGRVRPGVFADAGEHVWKHMYHYTPSPWVKKNIKPVIPFANWMVENTPEMIRFMGQWGKLEQLARGRSILKDMFPSTPEVKKLKSGYQRDRYPYELNLKSGDENLHVFFDIPMPMKDLKNFGMAQDSITGLAARTGVLGAVIAAAIDTKFFPKRKSTKGMYVEAPLWSVALTQQPWIMRAAPDMFAYGVVERGEHAGEYRLMMSDRWKTFLQSTLPSLGQMERMAAGHGGIRLYFDWDAIDADPQKHMIQKAKYNPTSYGSEKIDQEFIDIGKVEKALAPPSKTGQALTRKYKVWFPFVGFSWMEEQEVRERRAKELDRIIREHTNLDKSGNIRVFPPYSDIGSFAARYMAETY